MLPLGHVVHLRRGRFSGVILRCGLADAAAAWWDNKTHCEGCPDLWSVPTGWPDLCWCVDGGAQPDRDITIRRPPTDARTDTPGPAPEAAAAEFPGFAFFLETNRAFAALTAAGDCGTGACRFRCQELPCLRRVFDAGLERSIPKQRVAVLCTSSIPTTQLDSADRADTNPAVGSAA